MARKRRLADTQSIHQFTDAKLAVSDCCYDPNTGRVGECFSDSNKFQHKDSYIAVCRYIKGDSRLRTICAPRTNLAEICERRTTRTWHPTGAGSRSNLEHLSRGVYRGDVPVFGDQKGRGVGRIQSRRRLPFGFGYRRASLTRGAPALVILPSRKTQKPPDTSQQINY